MIKCQVEKKRTKSPESMRCVWNAADSQGLSGELSPGTSLGTWSCKRNKPTWPSAACKAQPSSSQPSCLPLLATQAPHTDSTTVAGPRKKKFFLTPLTWWFYKQTPDILLSYFIRGDQNYAMASSKSPVWFGVISAVWCQCVPPLPWGELTFS